eukprot:6221187-Prymnesium_polylepis.2
MGLSFGATLAHCIANAVRQEKGLARWLIMVDPNPPPPQPSSFFEGARQGVTLHQAAFNCIFGVFDGSVPKEQLEQVARDLSRIPEDALGAYVTSHYVRTGGMKGTPWDVMLVYRQLQVYRHCVRVFATLEAVQPFVNTECDPAILLVTASKRREFFAPMGLHDVGSELGHDKLPLLGPVAEHHYVHGAHTTCCIGCVSARDPVFVTKLRHCLDDSDVW